MADQLYHESARVLCPQLYQRLKTLSGEVVVANAGESLLHSTSFNPQTGRYDTNILRSGEYYRINCPFCQDTRHRLWVNHMYGQPDVHGKPMRFLANCWNENCLSDTSKWQHFNDSIFGFRNVNQRQSAAFQVLPGLVEDATPTLAKPPGEVIPISQLPQEHKAWRYMVDERRYSLATLDRYHISYCVRADPAHREWWPATDRIVFPVYMHRQLVGWQCRYIGKPPSEASKYFGMPGMKKRAMLYNYDYAVRCPFVVVVEGPTSANAVGDAAVALMGKYMSYTQLQLLTMGWERKPIVIMLDPDAKEQSRSVLNDLINLGTNPVVEIELTGSHDPSDYGYQAVWNIIRSQAAAKGVLLPT